MVPRRVDGIGKTLIGCLVSVAMLLMVSGCSQDTLADQYRSGSGKNYIAGDGTITEYAPEQRGSRVEFGGPLVDGGRFAANQQEGDILVVNFWYAGCAPCRAEAGILQRVADKFAGERVTFIGVNVRDQASTAAAFEVDHAVKYSSILDVDQGAVQLAFAGKAPPAAVPTTLVLDRQHRVAARVLGQLQDASILSSLIERVNAEPQSTAGTENREGAK